MKKFIIPAWICFFIYLLFSFVGFRFDWIEELVPRVIYTIICIAALLYYYSGCE